MCLNKFPVIEHHALIVTRDFQDQEAPLDRGDFEALWICLREGGLAFYNAGAAAGASERHRHLQLVPTPIADPPLATPFDAVQADAHFDGGIGRVASLPFLHGLGRLRAIANQPPAEAAEVLLGLYRQLARAFGCHRHGQPYNLLVCRDWMLIVPRARAQWRGVNVNGLGFAGALMVPGREELEVLRREGPLRVLAHVAVPLKAIDALTSMRLEPLDQRLERAVFAQRPARGVAQPRDGLLGQAEARGQAIQVGALVGVLLVDEARLDQREALRRRTISPCARSTP